MDVKSEVATVEAAVKPTFTQVEKFVAAFSPLIAVLVGYVATLVAKDFPGVSINQDELIWVFIVAFAGVVLLVIRWLEAKHRAILSDIQTAALAPVHFAEGILGDVTSPLTEAAVVSLIKKELESHSSEIDAIITDLEKQLPTQVVQVLQNLLKDVNLGDLLSGKVNLGDLLAAKITPAPVAPVAAPVTQS
jgi:hypothetical protein